MIPTKLAIITADRYSRAFESSRHPEEQYKDEAQRQRQALEASKSQFQRLKDWGKENRYPIVGASWVASMGIALALVGRSPYLTTSQKIVQARVYAQGLTLAVLIATAFFEIGDRDKGEGRWETVKVLDPDDPTHKHMIEKRIHHEKYAGEDMWRGAVFCSSLNCLFLHILLSVFLFFFFVFHITYFPSFLRRRLKNNPSSRKETNSKGEGEKQTWSIQKNAK